MRLKFALRERRAVCVDRIQLRDLARDDGDPQVGKIVVLKHMGDHRFRDVSVYVGVNHGLKGGQRMRQGDAADTRVQRSGVQESYAGRPFGVGVDLFAVNLFVVRGLLHGREHVLCPHAYESLADEKRHEVLRPIGILAGY